MGQARSLSAGGWREIAVCWYHLRCKSVIFLRAVAASYVQWCWSDARTQAVLSTWKALQAAKKQLAIETKSSKLTCKNRQHSNPRSLDSNPTQQSPRLDNDPRLPRLLPPRRLPNLPRHHPSNPKRCLLKPPLANLHLLHPISTHPHRRGHRNRQPSPPQPSRPSRLRPHARRSRQHQNRRTLPSPRFPERNANRDEQIARFQ